MALNTKQQIAYNIMCSKYNTFITGSAGTGKSYVLSKFIEDAQQAGLNVMITSPFGLAAAHINGVTLHNAFNIPIGPLTYRVNTYEPEDEIIETDILVIDEISTCRIDVFDFVINKVLKANNRRKKVGKDVIQIILCGDFLQLPPVMNYNDKVALDRYYGFDVEAGYAFTSKYWNMMDFKFIELDEVVRQDNPDFINNLNKVRVGNREGLDYFLKNSNPNEINDAIILCGLRDIAKKINEEKLAQLTDIGAIYKANITGTVYENDTQFEELLYLKRGSSVITVKNTTDYKNGEIGTVVDLEADKITVNINGRDLFIEPEVETIYSYELYNDENNQPRLRRIQTGEIKQFPLKLAYAITIHKSQGQTYEKVNIRPYCWDCGQLYVALSRVKDIKKMHLAYDIKSNYIKLSYNVVQMYNNMINKQNNENLKIISLEERMKHTNNQFNGELDDIINSLKLI